MAIRTDSSAVLLTIDTDLTTPQITQFIADASGWVDDNLGGETELGTATLEKIERYLTCHLITLRDPRLKSATLADVGEVYQRGLYMTEYLKMAMALDPTGKVAAAYGSSKQKGLRVQFKVGDGFDSRHDY